MNFLQFFIKIGAIKIKLIVMSVKPVYIVIFGIFKTILNPRSRKNGISITDLVQKIGKKYRRGILLKSLKRHFVIENISCKLANQTEAKISKIR